MPIHAQRVRTLGRRRVPRPEHQTADPCMGGIPLGGVGRPMPDGDAARAARRAAVARAPPQAKLSDVKGLTHTWA
jgi:hypothetical protein